MTYGFHCAYCDQAFDGPTDNNEDAYKAAQAAGWRFTQGISRRWGEGAHYTCPECLSPSEKETATAVWVDPGIATEPRHRGDVEKSQPAT